MKSEKPARIVLQDEQATLGLGERVAEVAFPGLLIRLVGPLGAGKTTLVRGIVRGMGGSTADVSSPSFTIMNRYVTPKGLLLHADLYRLGSLPDGEGIDDTGIYEALDRKSAVVAFEWAERLAALIHPSLAIELNFRGRTTRAGRVALITTSGGPALHEIAHSLTTRRRVHARGIGGQLTGDRS